MVWNDWRCHPFKRGSRLGFLGPRLPGEHLRLDRAVLLAVAVAPAARSLAEVIWEGAMTP